VCLGHAPWAALAWPTRVLDVDDDGLATYRLSQDGPGEYVHVTDPDRWQIVPYTAARVPVGIALRQTGPPEPLVRARLSLKGGLTFDDVVRLGRHCNVYRDNMRRADLLHEIAFVASQGDREFAEQVQQVDTGRTSKASIEAFGR